MALSIPLDFMEEQSKINPYAAHLIRPKPLRSGDSTTKGALYDHLMRFYPFQGIL